MRIENSNASFRANLINKITIGKLNKPDYKKQFVSFVKINPFNESDITALEDTSKYWSDDKFALNIYYACCALKNKSQYYKDHEIYALTSQISDFDKLESEKILGLVQVSPYLDSPMFIERIQANTEFLNKNKPEYKGIGTAIIDSLKLLSSKISCFPSSEQSVKNFYTKNGFVKQPDISNYYIWKKK